MDFYEQLLNPRRTKQQISGVVVAVVKETKDPKSLGRVKIALPWREKEDEVYWARLATLMAGNKRGTFFYPEKNDEVLVAFEHGDIDRPYIIGALWNSVDKTPDSNSEGENNIKMIKTRSGHTIKIDDTDGSEKIEIIDKSEENKICIDTPNKKISIECGEENKISIDSSGKKISIESGGDIELSASNGKVIIKAKEVEITNSSGSAKIKSSAGLDLEAAGTMNIKGATININ